MTPCAYKHVKHLCYLVWIEEKVTEFTRKVELFHKLILNYPRSTFSFAQPKSIVPDEVAHDLLGWRTLCSKEAVSWDVTDHLQFK